MKKIDFYILSAILIVVNIPLLWGEPNSSFIFYPKLVAEGEIWRIITHPFVHISWYHFLLDASAFLLLYAMLKNMTATKRIIYTALSGMVSLLFASLFSSQIETAGFCGLSGIAHGLMAAYCLEILVHSKDRIEIKTALITFLLLTAKCAYETVSGNVFFAFMHPTAVGSPIAISHTGGFIGAALVFVLGQLPIKHQKAKTAILNT